ncbi:hypothetical protein [Bacillus mobilis]|uniref:hypothetical protein n=1 Tax=Bacillus mobilis TaxID=2026190 RepID=UPI0013D65E4E|nr:hypothetical protein [Bacillus mobilis]NEL00330.1 hypothetical protein [Bacillus mobilis]
MQLTDNQYLKREFICPQCNDVAKQSWFTIKRELIEDPRVYPIFQENSSGDRGADIIADRDGASKFINWSFDISTCGLCTDYVIWVNKTPLRRNSSIIPLPHESMPDHIQQIYNEAENVFFTSHKAANMLLRIALKKLLQYIEENGLTNCNSDKQSMKLNASISHVLKSLKIFGDEGHLSPCLNDEEVVRTEEVTLIMFDLVNLIVGDKLHTGKKAKEIKQKLTLLRRN